MDRLRELSENPKLLKEFNKANFTDILEIKLDVENDYNLVDIVTKRFTFDIELFDDSDGCCYYNTQLKDTVYEYDFDDYVCEEDLRSLYMMDGELYSYDDVDIALLDILPSKMGCGDIEYRVKGLIKIKNMIENSIKEESSNQYFIVDFVKRICDSW